MIRALLVLAMALALSSCAPTSPAVVSPSHPTTPTAQKPAPKPAAPVAAAIDSTPSADAQAVLSTIPEPLKQSERVAPPDVPGETSGAPDVPTPAPTQPLGEHPAPATQSAPQTSSPPAAAPPSAAAAPGAAAGGAAAGAAPSNSDGCWRVQVAAPDTESVAQALSASATSLLLVPTVVEPENGRFKVRTRDCLNREDADRLRQRALDDGFTGAFLVKRVP
jgi:hypothetical protein